MFSPSGSLEVTLIIILLDIFLENPGIHRLDWLSVPLQIQAVGVKGFCFPTLLKLKYIGAFVILGQTH